MNITILYNRSAEKAAAQNGVDMSVYERACAPYVQIIKDRAEAQRSGDVDWFFQILSKTESRKHAAHNAAVSAARALAELGVYTGDINNRQQMGAFACAFCGESALAQYVD